ncbi:related to secretory pathway protein (exocyst complex protein Sec15) [Ustilago bromivora]|uniref:Exocyst complex component SEC15 n=1 Tax=Ustilago bromivora TaxID=307758 RepID=A0A8H8TTG3_9BASI|nr:related to secretory pathway protein (exocyst complex protein Sec15) [Ustilago bromivora]
MASRQRNRPLISLEAQLQQLTLFTDLDAETENLEQLGPIIKQLDQARQQDAFLRHLKSFVSAKDSEIEAICNNNHSEFVAAVDKLLKVRSGTVTLKHRIGELNEDVQAGGSSLGNKKKQLLETQRTGANVEEAIEAMRGCLRVLDLAGRVEGLIGEKKFFAALRSLEELEERLRGVMGYEFAKHMMEGIPQMRNQVKMGVTKEMKEWLYEVREKSRTVGQLALEAMESRQKRWRVKAQRDPLLRLAKVNSAIELVVNERTEYNFVDNEKVKVDFRPLYQCIHIHDALDAREELQASYQDDRRAQANLLLNQGISFTNTGGGGGGGGFPALLEEMVGFFIVEHDVISTTPSSFRSESEVDDLWETMCTRLVELVSLSLRDCKDTRIYVSAKTSIQLFIQTLETHGFPVTKLNALLLTLFERYAHLLRDRFSQDFQRAMQDTQHQPMVVSTREELNKVLGVSNGIRKSLDDTKGNSLGQISQIVVNAEHFNLACEELEKLLVALRAPSGRGGGGKLELGASKHFVETLRIAEVKIADAFGGKLDQFLGLAEYDFSPNTASGGGGGHSPWLQDMLDWLTTMMQSVLILLPASVKASVYASAYTHLAVSLFDRHLTGPESPACVNTAGLATLCHDVQFLAQQAKQDGVQVEALVKFEGVRQTLRCVLEDKVMDWVMALQSGKGGKDEWASVEGKRLVGLLEKLGKWGSRIGDEAEVAKRARERDAVVRLMNSNAAFRR